MLPPSTRRSAATSSVWVSFLCTRLMPATCSCLKGNAPITELNATIRQSGSSAV